MDIDDEIHQVATDITRKLVEATYEARNAIAREHGPQAADSVMLQVVLGFSTNILLAAICTARGEELNLEKHHHDVNEAIAKFITELVASKIEGFGGTVLIDIQEKRRQQEGGS